MYNGSTKGADEAVMHAMLIADDKVSHHKPLQTSPWSKFSDLQGIGRGEYRK